MNFNDLKISTRLSLGFGFGFGMMALLILFMGCVSMIEIRAVNQSFNAAVNISRSVAAGDLNLQFEVTGNNDLSARTEQQASALEETAKEIKYLINASVERVEQGTALVELLATQPTAFVAHQRKK